MSGLGWRKFAAGEVLTANNFQSYAVDQAVQTYAGTAARGSAIGTAVSEGMVSYLADTDLVQVYDGTNWKQMYPALPIAGQVVQVVQGLKTDSFSSTATSYTDVTGVSVTITPSSASNKVLVLCQFSSASYNQESWFRLTGGNSGTYIGDAAGSRERAASQFGAVANSARADNNSIIYLDSPATTSAITYKLQTKTISTGTVYVGRGYTDSDSTSIGRFPTSIIAIEVKG